MGGAWHGACNIWNAPATPLRAKDNASWYVHHVSGHVCVAQCCVAALISGPCWLVPVPDSTGSTDANARLAHAIANHCPEAQIAKAITRTQAIPSQCDRHKHALGPIPPDQHHIARTRKTLTLRQTYLVDNVTTSGNTLQAARDALGFGAGLVYADAATKRTQLQATLL